MNIGTIIKKTRREKDMTQEQLADYLNVSVSAVSQWESEKTTPDISVIPPLCNLLSITSDELLGINLEKKKEHIEEIRKRAGSFSSCGYYEEARKILTGGLKEYPNSYTLTEDLMCVASWQHDDGQYSEEERKIYLDEAICLGERILKGCTKDTIRHGAIQILCYSYRDKGNIEKAVSLAHTMPMLVIASESLLAGIHQGTKGYETSQRKMDSLFQSFENSMISNYKLDSGKYAYTSAEMAQLRDKQIALFDLVFENGDFGFYHTHLCRTHLLQAQYYGKENNREITLSHLEKSAEHAIGFLTCGGTLSHTSLIFRGFGSNKTFGTNDKNNDAARLKGEIKNQVFDFIRNDLEFKKIESRLTEYAGKWQVKE